MTLLKRLAQDEATRRAVDVVEEIAPALRTRQDSPRFTSSLQTDFEERRSLPHSQRWAVAGIGVWFPATGEDAVAAAFISVFGYKRRAAPLSEVSPHLADIVANALDLPADSGQLELVAVEPPREHGGPSSPIQATTSGTLGFRVNSPDEGSCILTAGHVVKKHLGRRVGDNHEREIGTVISRDCPSINPPGTDCVDFGLIRLVESYDAGGGPAYGKPPSEIKKRADVTMYGRFNTRSGWIEAICQSYVGALETHGDWAEVIRVYPRLSLHGESGSPVLLSESSEALGHVIGGGTEYTIVQDLEFLLETTRCGLA